MSVEYKKHCQKQCVKQNLSSPFSTAPTYNKPKKFTGPVCLHYLEIFAKMKQNTDTAFFFYKIKKQNKKYLFALLYIIVYNIFIITRCITPNVCSA